MIVMPKKKTHIRALAALLDKTTTCENCFYFEEDWPGSYVCKLSIRKTKKSKTCMRFTFEKY